MTMLTIPGRQATRAQLEHRRRIHAAAIEAAGPGPYRWPEVDRRESTSAYLERADRVREAIPGMTLYRGGGRG